MGLYTKKMDIPSHLGTGGIICVIDEKWSQPDAAQWIEYRLFHTYKQAQSER